MGNPADERRDFAALEGRRMAAARLLRQGLSQSQVARAEGVDRQSVSRWAQALGQSGVPCFAQGQAHQSSTEAQPSPVARPQARTRSVWLCQRAVDRGQGARAHRGPERGALPRRPRLAHSAPAGLVLASDRESARARGGDPALAEVPLAPDLKERSASGARSFSSTKVD